MIKTEAIKEVDIKTLKVSSTAFKESEFIPTKYTCDGSNINPPLDIEGIPETTKCLAIIMDDPDAPSGTWVHWVAWNIPVTHHLKENTSFGVQGRNDFKENKYGGPCPPGGIHRYFFNVYALDSLLNLPVKTTKQDLEKAMCDNILAYGELTGKYKRGR